MPLGTEVVLGPGYVVLDKDPAHPRNGPIYIVAKRSPISAPAELLFGDITLILILNRLAMLLCTVHGRLAGSGGLGGDGSH